MGNHLSSTEFETTELVAPKAPCVAIDEHFLSHCPLRLDMGSGPIVRDMSSGASMFRVDGDCLRDLDGHTFAIVKKGIASKTIVDAGDHELFVIKTGGSVARCSVQDPISGARHAYSVVGTLSSSKALILCDGEPVAKFRHNGSFHFGPCFHLDIAPGVDVALVVVLCLALFPSNY
ncbi:hypothetical protein LEN26_001319 [Aphanomyces euteiches]|uniref:Tubby C-terminal domain-containing protein n=1 Tax=Aphanomyces euteiches TaxID=100861 RepID=A0A6G0WSM9_9STRA|nr:hypothetical protein Ae201684_012134 [Aphanomyces euteiches]KAH9056148.1 hypothetical protein Ae201684P_021885 [Aphanomyces euteiches]KAH9108912.1 hypothetical protein AeMF1_015955 [Aphanomyces euteiches]KAH9134711.1 hypothetical protein AeRB84_019588 [Aphanomyces euteiches]KAH9161710.1 hypothetical protein LEN26_001319 [Aphanomyces euteiches]